MVVLTSDILQVILMKIANVQKIVFIDKSNKWFHASKFFQVVSHFYTWYQSYKTVVPQVILNFKWSSNEEKFPHTIRDKAYQIGWPMLWHRGRSPTTIGIKVTRSYTWCLKSYTNGVHKKYKIQAYTIYPNASLCINKKHTFMEIDDKGGEIVQRYESFGKDWDKEVEVWYGHGQRGSNIGSKFLDKRSTQVGGQAHELVFDCIWYVHIHELACIA